MHDTNRKAATVRALLAKAESAAAHFPEEARSLIAKAQELMARYHIDEAMLSTSSDEPGRITEITINLGSGPYVLARLRLLDAVATANGLRLLTSRGWDGRIGHLVGTVRATERAETLFTSLLTQAAAESLRPEPAGSAAGTIRWRRAFLFGYADEIAVILHEARHAAEDAAEAEVAARGGSTSVSLVLADERSRVDAWVRTRYGRVGTMRPAQAPGDGHAVEAGRAAARRADIGREPLPSRRELGR